MRLSFWIRPRKGQVAKERHAEPGCADSKYRNHQDQIVKSAGEPSQGERANHQTTTARGPLQPFAAVGRAKQLVGL
jgi:hypothetical protein